MLQSFPGRCRQRGGIQAATLRRQSSHPGRGHYQLRLHLQVATSRPQRRRLEAHLCPSSLQARIQATLHRGQCTTQTRCE